MKSINSDTWIQLLGMLSVLAGLVFVGLEMRQSQQIALAAQQQNRMSVFIDIINTMTEAGFEYAAAVPESEYVYKNFMHASFFILENDVVQYNLGLMEEGIWTVKHNALKGMMSTCTAREIFNFRKAQLDKRLVELAEDAIAGDCVGIEAPSMLDPVNNVDVLDSYRERLESRQPEDAN